MKVLKIFALIVGGVLLLALGVLGVALVPAVQTWAAHRLLAGRRGSNVEIGRLAVGPAGIDVRGLRTVQNGVVVTAAQISVRGSLWDYLVHQQVNLEEIAVRDLQVDARQAVAAPPAAHSPGAAAKQEAAEPSPALAIFGLGRPLPVAIKLKRVALDGRALLPGGRKVEFTVQGGGIAAGQQGRIQWKSDFADPAAGATVRAAHAAGTLDVHLATGRRIDAISLETLVSAEGPRLPADQLRLEVKAAQPSPGANETVDAHLGLVRAGAPTPLLNTHVEAQAATRELAGTWDLALQGDQVAALCAGLALPEFAIHGGGKFAFQGAAGTGTANGTLDGQVTSLERLGPGFSAVGALRLHAAFDGSVSRDVVRVGRLEFEVATPDGRRIAQVAAEQPVVFHSAEGRFELAKPDQDLAQISIADLPLAWAQPFVKPVAIEGGALSGALAVEVGAGGLEARVRTVRPLVFSGITLRDQNRDLVSDMTVSLSPGIGYSADKVTVEVPDLKASQPAGDSVDGSLSVQATHLSAVPVVSFRTNLQERLVAVLRPFLPESVGAVRVESTAEGVVEGPSLQLKRFASTVRSDGGALVAAVEALQPVTTDFGTERIAAADPASPAVRLRLGEIPLGLADAYVPGTELAGELTGGTFEVTLGGPGQFALQATAPLTLRGVGVTQNGRRLFQALDITADGTMARRDGAYSGEIRRLEVSRGSASLVKLAGTGEVRPGEELTAAGKGRLEADLAALGGQPALASLGALARGRLTADYDVRTAATVQAKIAVALSDLAARGSNQVVGGLDVAADATLKPDGSGGTARIPLKLKVGDRRSDLLFDGSFSRTDALLNFKGRLSGNQIFADDFRMLAGLVPSVPASEPSASPAAAATAAQSPPAAPAGRETSAAAPSPDTKPFWAGLQGRFDLDLKKIVYGPGNVISGVSGALVAEPARLAVEDFTGQLKDKPFKVAGAVTFAAGQAQPYALDGALDASGVDVGALLRAADPADPPALESILSVKAKVNGQGISLPDLLQKTYGQFDLTGSKGVLRALGKRGKLAGALSTVLGLVGALQGSDTTVAAGDLAGMLQEMPFDSLSARLVRGADLNLKLTSLELLSPTVRLTGAGRIQYQKGVPIVDQPLNVQLQLAGKNEMAVVLNRLRLLNGQQDDKKYYLMDRPFVVSGTLAKPDADQLWSMVAEAAAGGLLR